MESPVGIGASESYDRAIVTYFKRQDGASRFHTVAI